MVGTGGEGEGAGRGKRVGWGSLGALERAKRERAATWERVRLAEEDGSRKRREAEEERQKAAGLVQQAYSGGYEHPIEVGGGGVHTARALTLRRLARRLRQRAVDKQDDAYGR